MHRLRARCGFRHGTSTALAWRSVDSRCLPAGRKQSPAHAAHPAETRTPAVIRQLTAPGSSISPPAASSSTLLTAVPSQWTALGVWQGVRLSPRLSPTRVQLPCFAGLSPSHRALRSGAPLCCRAPSRQLS